MFENFNEMKNFIENYNLLLKQEERETWTFL